MSLLIQTKHQIPQFQTTFIIFKLKNSQLFLEQKTEPFKLFDRTYELNKQLRAGIVVAAYPRQKERKK